MPMNHEERTMLALAALTYRGFGRHSEAEVRAKVQSWLPKLQKPGTWELAWGPACFRAEGSLVDDAMMFVVRQTDHAPNPPRFVVAIRGTNPVSFFDWYFGDLWVRHQVPWPNAENTRLSASTALGLEILKNLTAEEEASTTATRLMEAGDLLANAFQRFAHTLEELFPERVLAPGGFTDADLLRRLDLLTREAPDLHRAIDALQDETGDPDERIRDVIARHVFRVLRRLVEKSRGPGVTLLDFLRSDEIPDGATVSVVGHSKGGALAVAAALWLEEEWAAAKRARIECFAFAGPTAGNGAFAEHYDRKLGAKTRSIVNERDLVPHAWAIAQLGEVRDIHPELALFIRGLTESVRRLGYTHVGGKRILTAEQPRGQRGLVEDIIHQHLDVYLQDARFEDPDWNMRSIFLDP